MRRTSLRPLLALAAVLLAAVAPLAATGSAGAADVAVHATVDRAQLGVGEAADLGIEITGAQDVPAPGIDDVDGLRVRYVGPSSQLSIVNGRTSASVTHHYSLTALKPGTFTVGPITIEYGGRRYDAGTVTIQAASSAAAARGGAGGDKLRLTLTSPRTRAYLHERVPMMLTLTVGAVQVTDVHYPSIPGDGFALEPLREPSQRREQTAQGTVQVVEFPTVLTPLRAGALTVGPAALEMTVAVRGGRDPFFDRFLGGDPFGARRPLTLQSEPLQLEVLPLPDAGKPAGFSGAVGRFEMHVDAGPRQLKTGDPVTITTTIDGEGNLEGIDPPAVAASDALKVYPVQAVPQPTASPVPGRRPRGRAHAVFEQVVIPARAGAVALPEIRFSYFDPEAAAYRTLTAPPVALTVEAATAPAEGPIGASLAAPAKPAAPETLGRDIVFIKDAPGALVPIGARRFRSPAFWALQLVPLTLWALVVVVDRRRRRLRADPRWARYSTAGRSARRDIAAAEASLRAGDRPAFYDRLAHTLREYLSAKLDLPPGAATAETIVARVRDAGVPADVARDLGELLATCERVRFAPGGDSDGDMRQALVRAEAVVRALERAGRPAARTAATALVVAVIAAATLVVVAIAAATLARAADAPAPNTIFFHANTLYGEERYAEAAAEYERIVDAGLESAPLYFNLGNAWFKAGDVGRAVLAYERALRLAPADPDVQANLRFAREGDADEGPSLPSRVLFPFAARVATDTLLAWSSALYALAMLLLIVARLVPAADRTAKRAALVMGVALVVTASSAAFRLVTVDLPTYAVVVAPAGTTVRFEPSATGTAHFDAKVGSVLRVLAARDQWAQVARRDGTRGWVPADAITRL